MAYNSKTQMQIFPITEDTLDGANDLFTFTWQHPVVIHRVEFWVTTLVAADMTSPVLALDYTPSGGSRTEWATITLTEADAAGSVQEPDSAVNPLQLSDGDSITFEVKTAGTDSGSVAGAGYYVIWYENVGDVEVS